MTVSVSIVLVKVVISVLLNVIEMVSVFKFIKRVSTPNMLLSCRNSGLITLGGEALVSTMSGFLESLVSHR